METVSNLTGQPITAVLSGTEHKFRLLTLAELFGKFEADIKNDWMVRAHEMGNQMNMVERIEFLSHQASHPLSAEDSMRLVRDKMNSAKGVELILSLTHLKESNNDNLPEITSLMMSPTDKITVRSLVETLTGTTGVKVEDGKDSPKA
jgi:hypothetical protein